MSTLIPPPLRAELKIQRLVEQGVAGYVIKEPDKHEYYHFDEAQYQMLQLFDGNHDLTRLVETFNQQSAEYEFDIDALSELYENCRDYQLLRRTRAEQNTALLELIREQRKKKLLQAKGDLLLMRFHLLDPDRAFNHVIDSIRFLWTPTAVRIQLAMIFTAVIIVLLQGDRFIQDFQRVYLQSQAGVWGWISIWVIALVAIALHECGHGLTCKKYGGEVRDMGFLLLVFQPCLYCNVNDAWLFEHKRHKIYVALAGVWVEMMLAALAAFVWFAVDVANPLGFIAFVLMTIGTASSLLINLNPLLKFDGYYILTDALEMKNLRQNSLEWFSFVLKLKLLRMELDPPFHPSPRERKIYFVYGMLVVIYMVALLSFIGLIGYEFISAQFGFFANLMFIYLVVLLIKKLTGSWMQTLGQWCKEVFWLTSSRKRITLAVATLLLVLLIFWQPNMRVHSQGQVEAELQVIYAPEDSFVSYLAYDQNRQITARKGEPLLRLFSPTLTLEKQQLESALQALAIRLQGAMASEDSSTLSRLVIEQKVLAQKWQKLSKQIASLSVYKPEGQWRVEGIPPQSLQGRFIAQGDEIITLAAARSRHINVIVDQRDVYLLKLGDRGRIRFTGVAPTIYQGEIKQMAPVATRDGIEQSFTVKMELDLNGQQVPPLGLSADVIIFGEQQPLWRHFLHRVRKILRADLWL